MTAHQFTVEDCDPSWADGCEPTNRPPDAFDLRQTEMRDLRGQNAGPVALWTADDVPTGSYL